jgi:polyisoprenoid-binding protein YceI
MGAFALAAFSGPANSQNADAAAGAISGEYKADQGHRYITFDYDHQGYSRPFLRWREWDATLDWNAEDPTASTVKVSIDANSIDSGVDVFDGHLRGEQFFDVENHPTITFKSTSLEKTGDDTGKMTGDLTIKGNTKPVTLDVTFNKGAFEARSNSYKLGFSAKGVVKRSDFGVDAFTPVVSDDVNLTVEVEFEMPADEE